MGYKNREIIYFLCVLEKIKHDGLLIIVGGYVFAWILCSITNLQKKLAHTVPIRDKIKQNNKALEHDHH